MNELERKISAVARRMVAVTFLRLLLRCIFYAVCLVAALALADKLIYLALPVPIVSAVLLGACVPAALVLTWLTGVTQMKAAMLADKHLGLKERLSSALAVEHSPDAMAPEVVRDALRFAARLESSRAVPFRTPREGLWLPVPLVAAALIFTLMPPLDLFERKAQAERFASERRQVSRQAERLEQIQKEIKNLQINTEQKKNDAVARVVKNMEKVKETLKAPSTNRQAAMIEMAKLSDDIRRERDAVVDVKDLAAKLKDMEPLETDLARQLAEALQTGDMKQVAQEIEKLQEAIKNADVKPDELEKVGRELERLAKQLDPEKAAELQKRLQAIADALKNAGQNNMANPDDIQDALDNLAMLDTELMDIDELLEQLAMLEQAIKEGKAQLADMGQLPGAGEGKEGDGNGPGKDLALGGSKPYKGIGENGQVFGPRPMGPKEPVDFEARKTQIEMQPGKMLGGITFTGQPPKDAEALAEYQDIVGTATSEAEEVLPKTELPAHRKDQVKNYFDSFKGEEEE